MRRVPASADPLSTLAVVVVNYGSHQLVDANLSQSLGADFPGHVVVVDNFSSTQERAAIAGVCDRHGWNLLPLPANEGFGGGNNRGVAFALNAGASEMLFLNPDAWLPPSAIRALHDRVRVDRDVQLSPEVRRPDGSIYSAEVDLQLAYGEMRSTRRRPTWTTPDSVHTWVSGACFMMSADLWSRVGGFDDDYFLYWEDVDLSRRVVTTGGTVQVDSTVHAVHDEGATHRKGSDVRVKSPTYYYYNTRNRLVYAAKHLSASDGRRWIWCTPWASYRILLQGGRRQFAHPTRNVWPALLGSRDGIRFWLTRATAGRRNNG